MQDWLHNALREYRQSSRTFFDIESCIRHYPSLLLKQEDYTYDNGVTQRLVCMVGTIPVTFKNQRYNIPIRVWISVFYPDEAPIVYVEPTASMSIRVSSFVVADGRVYSPCQQSWGYSLPSHEMTISFLLSQLCEMFSSEPPVYSKQVPTPPPITPPPASNIQTPGLYPQHPVYTNITNPATLPPAIQVSSTNYYHSSPQPQPQVISSHPVITSISTSDQDTNIRNAKLLSLRSAMTEKLSTNILLAKKELEDEANSWIEKKKALESHSIEIESALSVAEHEIQEMRQAIKTLKSQSDLVKSFMSMNEAQVDKLGPDEYGDLLLETKDYHSSSIVQKQHQKLSCEIHALDDTIYHLSQLFYQEDVIDLNLFLKHIRMLARQVFLNKALMNKCEAILNE